MPGGWYPAPVSGLPCADVEGVTFRTSVLSSGGRSSCPPRNLLLRRLAVYRRTRAHRGRVREVPGGGDLGVAGRQDTATEYPESWDGRGLPW